MRNQNVVAGNLIHADETHVSVKGKDSYVWVFTSMEDVVYIWSETREGSTATDFLKEFKGYWYRTFILLTIRQLPPAEMLDSLNSRLER